MRRWTRSIGVAAAIAVLVGAIVVGYRVFAPNELITRPTVPYPAAGVLITDERPFSELRAAPLVVHQRLRVYAEKRRIWSDAPVGERYESTPYWALRRWPEQVLGVVAAERADGAVVVSQWSDGEIIALDARRGDVVWRTQVPVTARPYEGRRTGASVVYAPRSLLTARVGQRTVLIVTGPGLVRAFDAATGAALWQRTVAAGCEPAAWTGAQLVALPQCAGPLVVLVNALDGREQARWVSPKPTVAPAPQLCQLNRSECRLITVAGQSWLLGERARLTTVPPLEPGAIMAGARVIYSTATGVAARSLTSREPVWTWVGKGELVGADERGVYLLTADRTVLGLSPTTGHLAVLGCASGKPDEGWRTGHVYATAGGYLALERITGAPPEAEDDQYFFGPRPVALVELYPPTKLPVWPGKFAACRPL